MAGAILIVIALLVFPVLVIMSGCCSCLAACLQVKKAFSERRKMLRNTLQPLYTTQQVRM